MSEQRKYSTWRRPFRLQLSATSAVGFDAPASKGQCQYEGGCDLWEWRNGARFCRDHWLEVYHRDVLPDRQPS